MIFLGCKNCGNWRHTAAPRQSNNASFSEDVETMPISDSLVKTTKKCTAVSRSVCRLNVCQEFRKTKHTNPHIKSLSVVFAMRMWVLKDNLKIELPGMWAITASSSHSFVTFPGQYTYETTGNLTFYVYKSSRIRCKENCLFLLYRDTWCGVSSLRKTVL